MEAEAAKEQAIARKERILAKSMLSILILQSESNLESLVFSLFIFDMLWIGGLKKKIRSG